MSVSFKGAHFPPLIILMGIRWYPAYPLSTRHVEELLQERGVNVDHSTINRWIIKYSPQLEAEFHRRKRRQSLSDSNQRREILLMLTSDTTCLLCRLTMLAAGRRYDTQPVSHGR